MTSAQTAEPGEGRERPAGGAGVDGDDFLGHEAVFEGVEQEEAGADADHLERHTGAFGLEREEEDDPDLPTDEEIDAEGDPDDDDDLRLYETAADGRVRVARHRDGGTEPDLGIAGEAEVDHAGVEVPEGRRPEQDEELPDHALESLPGDEADTDEDDPDFPTDEEIDAEGDPDDDDDHRRYVEREGGEVELSDG